MVTKDQERGSVAGQSSEGALERGAVVLTQGPGDAMPDADLRALRCVMQETGQKELRVSTVAGHAQGCDDIQTVALIGAMHRLEESQLSRREPRDQGGSLIGRDPAGQVPDELAGLARPPATH
jgi:hypothetical protein